MSAVVWVLTMLLAGAIGWTAAMLTGKASEWLAARIGSRRANVTLAVLGLATWVWLIWGWVR